MKPLRFLTAAEAEMMADFQWYERRESGLGDDFLSAIAQAVATVEATPEQFPRDEFYRGSRDVRRCRVKRFPYQVLFEIRDSEIAILAVAHHRRRPGYWKSRR